MRTRQAKPNLQSTTRPPIALPTRGVVAVLAVALLAAGCSGGGADQAAAGAEEALPRQELDAAVERAMTEHDLRALLVRVTVAGEPAYEVALGESLPAQPATVDMRFRNGAFAFTLMTTLLMVLVDEGEVTLDDTLDTWMPELPESDRVTLRNLADMTAGYADYVWQPEMVQTITTDPFRHWSPEELIAVGIEAPMLFEPGANWGYSHTNYVILGRVLEQVTGLDLGEALRRHVLEPMGTTGTTSVDDPSIPGPVLHSYSSERRADLGIPVGQPFIEDATFWDPSWTTAAGAVMSSTVADLTTMMETVGTGRLLSEESFAAQTEPSLLGFGQPTEQCPPCRTNTEEYTYALGVALRGPWLAQTKNFAGSGATAGYRDDEEVALAVVTTLTPAAFDDEGNYPNPSVDIFTELGDILAAAAGD